MATVAGKLITADEFYDFVHLPENRDRILELEKGEIVEMSRPGKRHGCVCANGVAILVVFARGRRKGYVCSNDTGVIVERDPDTVRGPDIQFFEDANTFEEIDLKYSTTPARLAIEVLSPNDTHGKLMRRVNEQLRFGTPLVWVVDPEAENITVYRPGKEPYIVERDQEITGEDILPDLRCRVAEFFLVPGE